MHTRHTLTVLLSAVLLTGIGAKLHAGPQRDGPQFIFDTGFDLRFDNREYGGGTFSPSGTIFGARFSPAIGFTSGSYNTVHTLMGGAVLTKDFGGISVSGSDVLRDAFLWYSYERGLGRELVFGLTGGIFPRTMSRESWSTAFFSERRCWYDPYMEGLLLSLDGGKGRVELGCDWLAMYGTAADVKEQFLLFSAGHYKPLDRLKLGYNGYMMHLAASATAPGVADNILVEPYLEVDLGGRRSFFSEFTLRLGYLQSLQRDRVVSNKFKTPALGEFTLGAVHSVLGIGNSFYYGLDILPLYDSTDTGGVPYADRLYFSDPFFRIRQNSDGKCGFYDRLEVFWTPRLGKALILKFAAVFHFNSGSFSGSQQIISLSYVISKK